VITAVIVGASLIAGAGFTAAWLLRPGLRAWVEAPKHAFLERARQYDRRGATGHGAGTTP